MRAKVKSAEKARGDDSPAAGGDVPTERTGTHSIMTLTLGRIDLPPLHRSSPSFSLVYCVPRARALALKQKPEVSRVTEIRGFEVMKMLGVL